MDSQSSPTCISNVISEENSKSIEKQDTISVLDDFINTTDNKGLWNFPSELFNTNDTFETFDPTAIDDDGHVHDTEEDGHIHSDTLLKQVPVFNQTSDGGNSICATDFLSFPTSPTTAKRSNTISSNSFATISNINEYGVSSYQDEKENLHYQLSNSTKPICPSSLSGGVITFPMSYPVEDITHDYNATTSEETVIQESQQDQCEQKINPNMEDTEDDSLDYSRSSNGSEESSGHSDMYQKEFTKPPTTAKITLEDLKEVFDLERPKAEKRLNLKRTTFSNLSRHFGISKWPYRTIRDVRNRQHANDAILQRGSISKDRRRKLLDQQRNLEDVIQLIYTDPTESRDSNTLAVLLKIVESRRKGGSFG